MGPQVALGAARTGPGVVGCLRTIKKPLAAVFALLPLGFGMLLSKRFVVGLQESPLATGAPT